jgi:hypothetical protein
MIIQKGSHLENGTTGMRALELGGWKPGVELDTRVCETGSGGTPAPRNSPVPALANHISPTAAQCLCWPRKKVEIRPILDRGPFSSSHYVGGLESINNGGADEWRAGKSGPGALGSLPESPTGSTSYELLSTD